MSWVKGVEHITFDIRNGEAVFFSNAPEQQHLQHLVEKQRPHKVAHRACRNIKRANQIQSTPRTWTNSLIFRRNQLTKQAYRHHERFVDQSFEANQTFGSSLSLQRHDNVAEKPLKRFKSTLFEHEEKTLIVEHDKTQSDKSDKTTMSSFTFFTKRLTDEVRKIRLLEVHLELFHSRLIGVVPSSTSASWSATISSSMSR